MRFSLKGLLALTAYLALAAAAFTHDWPGYATALALASFAAIVYAVLVAYLARGRQHAQAIGFAVGFTFCLGCAQFAPPGSSPQRQLDDMIRALGAPPDADATGSANRPAGILGMIRRIPSTRRYLAAGAIACMIAGLTGGILGGIAYRQSRLDDSL